MVEEYDDGYYALFRDLEATARHDLAGGQRHVFEARMKEDRRTHGERHHEGAPAAGGCGCTCSAARLRATVTRVMVVG